MSIRTRGAALLAALACVSLIVIGSVPKSFGGSGQPPRPSPFPIRWLSPMIFRA